MVLLFIIMPRSLTCSLSSMFDSSYDLLVVADFISCFFQYRRSSNLLALNFILFVSAHLYSLCKSFCSICVSSSSFIPKRIRVLSAKHDTVESAIQGVPQKCTLFLYYLYLQLKLRYFKSVYFIL